MLEELWREDGFPETKGWALSPPRVPPCWLYLHPPLGLELHIPPSPPLVLSLDLLMVLFSLSVNVLSSQVYSVIKN